MIRGEGEIWRKRTTLLRAYRTNASELELKIVKLNDLIRKKVRKDEHMLELGDLSELLIDENHNQKRKMIKLYERQEEIIRTLKKLKVKL